MTAGKLQGRCEQPNWQPPYLTFTVERHKVAVYGSTRAELQDWRIDISSLSAEIVAIRRRQLRPQAAPIDVKSLAAPIADAILNNRESPSLKRYADGRVKVLIGTIIPDDGFKQTIGGRRRRFRAVLENLLSGGGMASSCKQHLQAEASSMNPATRNHALPRPPPGRHALA